MGKLSVSMSINWELDMEETVNIFKKMKVDRVFMAFVERGPFKSGERRRKQIELYKKKRKILEENGFETAVWISTLGYGGACEAYNRADTQNYIRNTSILGNFFDDCFCPEDENFVSDMCAYVEELAVEGVTMMMLDDELALSAVPGIGCACDIHMRKYCELIGEEIKREELADKIFTGGKNKYRDAWLKLQGDTLRNFCRRLRNAADRIKPDMRMGFCSGYTSWDLEGADAIELSKILAGKTEPFLRFTGAPYWYACKRFDAQMMQSIVEMTRQQYEWCKNQGVEVFTEADSYPHNRFQVPSAYVEGYDLATRVSDNMSNLKYVVGYYSQPWYEKGYSNEHLKHLTLYDEISEAFDDKASTGIRIYESMRVIENMDLPDKFIGEKSIRELWINNHSSMIPTAAAIPTTYSGDGLCGMAFGEHAKYLPENAFKNGLILDVKAAEILEVKGIDTGLASKRELEYMPTERFAEYKTDVFLACYTKAYDITLKPGAKVLSTFYYEGKETPSAYLYENKDGQRFMVYAFNMEDMYVRSGLLLSYCRGKQLNDCIEWLSGNKMPLECNGHPMLYCICKENEKELAAGYFNFHADEIIDAEVVLSYKPKEVRFINCDGMVTEKGVIIKHIKSFGFAGIVFSKD